MPDGPKTKTEKARRRIAAFDEPSVFRGLEVPLTLQFD
jgi:hypothetical protein